MGPDNGVLNFALANGNLPAIIFCSSSVPGWRVGSRIDVAVSATSSVPGWRVGSRIDVAVSAVGYRAFVFAAPPYFVAGNRSTESRGAVSVGAVPSARRRQKKFLPYLRGGVPGFGYLRSSGR